MSDLENGNQVNPENSENPVYEEAEASVNMNSIGEVESNEADSTEENIEQESVGSSNEEPLTEDLDSNGEDSLEDNAESEEKGYENPIFVTGDWSTKNVFDPEDTDPVVEEKPEKKKGSTGLKIALIAAVAVAAGCVGFLVYNLVSQKNAEVQPDQAIVEEQKEVPEVSLEDDTEGETKKMDEKKKGVADLIQKVDGDIRTVELTDNGNKYDVSAVVENIMPCVVSLTDNLEIVQSYTNPYAFFFDDAYDQGGKTQKSESYSTASGIIVGQNDSELLICTNNHVVDNEGNYSTYSVSSKGISVIFCDDTTYEATIKGTDDDMDLAIVAVPLEELSEETKDAIRIAAIGSSDDVKVGNGVIAIGNALGYGQSVTTGIISAKDREVSIENGKTKKLLQTDAAINGGNSGGGLFNMRGELVGINEGKYSSVEVEGMGFAIPISKAESVIKELMNRETIAKGDEGFLGINGETVPEAYIKNYNYPAGVVVTRIVKGTPAEESELEIYDIITAVNGKEISSMDALREYVNTFKGGTVVTLTIYAPSGSSFEKKEIQVQLLSSKELDVLTSTTEEATTAAEENAPQAAAPAPEETTPEENATVESAEVKKNTEKKKPDQSKEVKTAPEKNTEAETTTVEENSSEEDPTVSNNFSNEYDSEDIMNWINGMLGR